MRASRTLLPVVLLFLAAPSIFAVSVIERNKPPEEERSSTFTELISKCEANSTSPDCKLKKMDNEGVPRRLVITPEQIEAIDSRKPKVPGVPRPAPKEEIAEKPGIPRRRVIQAKVEEEDQEEEETEDALRLIVIDNNFPKELVFFCQIRTRLQRDRFCYRHLDAYLLACPDGTPPIFLVPFCLAYAQQCSKLAFPEEKWCVREFDHYEKFCTAPERTECSAEEQCGREQPDYSCHCEPFTCLARRQVRPLQLGRFELFCDAEKRTEKSDDLANLLKDSVNVHKQCLEFLLVARTICNPFRPDFDHERCMKFLFDCELISDFGGEKVSPNPGKTLRWRR
ncbi:hypothetical protein QR680_012842 [Steinernema hermaphroditum]|uniref:FZ domain-containing protein n=1 Tax=Steinernema hermaphroditum TaxID=289476 RepID=A0AA39I3F8_9BILA|nr:hypothetical protein QR680_012842 [Steinernema hermaphroditum]